MTVIPNLPGRIQRGHPKPFQRPSVTIGGGAGLPAGPRTWRVIPVTDVRVGDIVPTVGIVNDVSTTVEAPPPGSGLSPQDIADRVIWQVTLRGGVSHDNQRTYHGSATVYAFTTSAR